MVTTSSLTPFQHRLLHGPILPTLLAFAAPNLVAFCSGAIVSIAETAYVGMLGVPALAGITIVFPIIMLMQTLSGGAFGGAVSGAVSRALGAGDQKRAELLAVSAFAISLVFGVAFALIIWVIGPWLFEALGARDDALNQAIAYGHVIAAAVVGIWVTNILAAVIRGAGHMTFPAVILLVSGFLQIVLGASFAFGLGSIPGLGIAGIALGSVVATILSALLAIWFLRGPKSAVRLSLSPSLISRTGLGGILKQGLFAALSPIQTIATVILTTYVVSHFGAEALAGFGIGSRLEFLLIPVAFSIGVGSIPLVGAAIGAGNVERARRVAWTAACVAAMMLGLIGAFVTVAPDAWARLFVGQGPALETARDYLTIVGIGFPFFGISLCLYFASQGAGRLTGPILAQSLRLVIVAAGSWFILQSGGGLTSIFILAAAAMTAQGLAAILGVWLTPWR